MIFYCFPTTNTRNRWVKTNTEIVGYLVESVIANALEKQLFWRTPQKDEVDFIVDKKLPIEVKYQSQITNDDVKSLLKFCKKFHTNKGIVITRDLLERREIDNIEILLKPVWYFLLYWDSTVV